MEPNRIEVMMIHETVMALKKKEFEEFFSNIAESVGTSIDDLNTLQWIIEDYYDERFKHNLDYFEDNRELLIESNLELFEELDVILKRLVELEQYEKCSIIKTCIDEFLKHFIIK